MNYEMMSDVELYKLMRSGDMKAGLLYARKAYEKNEYEECLQIAREMDDTEIEDMECLKEKWELLGQAYLKLGKIEDAANCFENAKELRSENAQINLLDGELALYQKDDAIRERNDYKIIDDKALADLEGKALQGDGELSYKIGQLYGFRQNTLRQNMFMEHAKSCGYAAEQEDNEISSGSDKINSVKASVMKRFESAQEKRKEAADDTQNKNFYVLDLMKRIVYTKNIPVLVYLVLNTIFVCAITAMIFSENMNPILAIILGIILYLCSVTVALSPLGEKILRFQNGCKKIDLIDYSNRIEPLFHEVYQEAKQRYPSLADDIQLFMKDDGEKNAFATGRKTVCVTTGMMYASDDEIKAALGHEFGHLVHKDTDLILLVAVGNLIFTALITIAKVLTLIVGTLVEMAFRSNGTITRLFTLILIDSFVWVWTKLGTWLVLKSGRENEYLADQFSFELGYGNGLCKLLDSFSGGGQKGLFAALESTHPDKDERIARLQKMGCSYGA